LMRSGGDRDFATLGEFNLVRWWSKLAAEHFDQTPLAVNWNFEIPTPGLSFRSVGI
jgi:hypothetical protein